MKAALVIGLLIINGMLQASHQTGEAPRLVVDVRVDNEKYCAAEAAQGTIGYQPSDVVSLRLGVRLYYHNQTHSPLILPIYHEVSAVLLSSTLTDAQKGLNWTIIPMKPRQKPSDELPSDISTGTPFNPLFRVIPGDGTLDIYFNEYVVLPVYDPSSLDPHTELRGTTVYVQLEISHLGLAKNVGRELMVKWRRYGYLWTGKVKTKPIRVDIPKSPTIGDCSHEYQL